jgi:FG-GAP repeat
LAARSDAARRPCLDRQQRRYHPTRFQGFSGFGSAVAISGDGSTILVGESYDNSGTGSALAFRHSGAGWAQQGGRLTASDETGRGAFGASLALSSNGTVAVIGGPGDQQGNAKGTRRGSAWVFRLTGSGWAQQGSRLVPKGQSGSSLFGASAAVSSNGAVALLGGPLDDNARGAVWAFVPATG